MAKPLLDLQQHCVASARVFATRVDALSFWPQQAVVAELGVAFGDFTQLILERAAPRSFDAYDIFVLHEHATMMGRNTKETFNGKTHRQWYETRFRREIELGQIRVFEGDGAEQILRSTGPLYDVIYIDADHSETAVQRDVDASIQRLRPGGLLVFNDYVRFDRYGRTVGVIPVVNDLCCILGWRVEYVALEREGHLDVALSARER
jgi:Methyltransferase domain